MKQIDGGDAKFSNEDLIEFVINRFPSMDHHHRVAFFSKVLELFGPYVVSNGAFWVDIFEVAERSGVNIIPSHYYSPIPSIGDYPKAEGLPLLFDQSFGVDVPPAGQPALFDVVCTLASELVDVPLQGAAPNEMRWSNGMYGVMDSCVYYGMMRYFKPALVMEVGSGFSTLVAARAAARNKTTVVECLEPYPVDFYSRHLIDMREITLTTKRVQDVPLSHFARLTRNDVLFIDSSHVVKSGSDVEFLIFQVLPKLSPGVLVHFHDIYLPYSYSRANLEQHKRFWNENYVLGAYLANSTTWEVLISNCTLSTPENNRRLGEILSPNDPEKRQALLGHTSGGSLWIRRL